MATETFLLSVVTLATAFCTGALGIAYKSKCSEVSCCCFKVKRDTVIEMKEDMVNIKIPETTLYNPPLIQTMNI